MNFICNYDENVGIMNCDVPYITAVDMGDGRTGYFSGLWTGGDVLICIFLFTLIIFMISKELFRFFFPMVIKIKKKYE